VSTRLSSY